MKKSILFGAGKIARGFLGQLLYLSDFEITFVDVYEPIVSVLNEKKTYHVHVLGDESLDSDVTHIKAYLFDNKYFLLFLILVSKQNSFYFIYNIHIFFFCYSYFNLISKIRI